MEGNAQALAQKLGIAPGWVVQEVGYDTDVDDSITDAIEAVGQLVNEDYNDVVDAVLLWWRNEDGDLVDALVDALGPLADEGVIWLMTPKPGRSGHVEPSDISDAAPTSGLQATSTISAASDWQGTRLVAPKSRR